MHGHRAITAGFHANHKHHGMSLCWQLRSVTMVGKIQNKGRTLLAGPSFQHASVLVRRDGKDECVFVILENTLGMCHRVIFNPKSHFSDD